MQILRLTFLCSWKYHSRYLLVCERPSPLEDSPDALFPHGKKGGGGYWWVTDNMHLSSLSLFKGTGKHPPTYQQITQIKWLHFEGQSFKMNNARFLYNYKDVLVVVCFVLFFKFRGNRHFQLFLGQFPCSWIITLIHC